MGRERRLAFILEDVVERPDLEKGYDFFRSLPYQHIDADRKDTQYIKHWVCHLENAKMRRNPIVRGVVDHVERFLTHRELESAGLKRVYVNFNLFGDFQLAHADGDEWTALFFANSRWDSDWGGELLLYGDDQDIALAIQPRPGRLVIFDGLINHRGGVPSKLHLGPRITLAMKLNRPSTQRKA